MNDASNLSRRELLRNVVTIATASCLMASSDLALPTEAHAQSTFTPSTAAAFSHIITRQDGL